MNLINRLLFLLFYFLVILQKKNFSFKIYIQRFYQLIIILITFITSLDLIYYRFYCRFGNLTHFMRR